MNPEIITINNVHYIIEYTTELKVGDKIISTLLDCESLKHLEKNSLHKVIYVSKDVIMYEKVDSNIKTTTIIPCNKIIDFSNLLPGKSELKLETKTLFKKVRIIL